MSKLLKMAFILPFTITLLFACFTIAYGQQTRYGTNPETPLVNGAWIRNEDEFNKKTVAPTVETLQGEWIWYRENRAPRILRFEGNKMILFAVESSHYSMWDWWEATYIIEENTIIATITRSTDSYAIGREVRFAVRLQNPLEEDARLLRWPSDPTKHEDSGNRYGQIMYFARNNNEPYLQFGANTRYDLSKRFNNPREVQPTPPTTTPTQIPVTPVPPQNQPTNISIRGVFRRLG